MAVSLRVLAILLLIMGTVARADDPPAEAHPAAPTKIEVQSPLGTRIEYPPPPEEPAAQPKVETTPAPKTEETTDPCAKFSKFDEAPLKEAVRLTKAQHFEAAHAKINKAYDLSCKEVPAKAALYDCEILGRLDRWQESYATADRKLEQKLPWLPDHLHGRSKSEDLGELSKLNGDELALMRCAADSRSELYSRNFERLSLDRRKQLREETFSLGDLLSQANYSPDKIQRFQARISSREDVQIKKPWKRKFQFLLSYMTWEERSPFFSTDQKYAGTSNVMAYCVGGAFSYQNGYYSLDAGGCVGIGKGQSQIDAADYDASGSVQAFSAFGKAIRKFSESGSGFGVQLGILNRSIAGHLVDGTPVTASRLDFDVLAVGRLNFGRVFFDLKGGSVLGQPSALWSLELGYLF